MNKNQYQRILRDGDVNILHSGYRGIYWTEKEVKRIKKITDLEKQVEEAKKLWEICDRVYTTLYNPPLGVNSEALLNLNLLKLAWEELRELKNKNIPSKPKSTPNINSQNKNYSSCTFCKTKSNLYHLIYNEITNTLQWASVLSTGNNIEKVFCNQGCFDEWWRTKHSKKEPIKPQKPTNNNNLGGDYEPDNHEPVNTTNETCFECNKSLQVGDECYYKKNDNKKFCSSDCYDKHYKTGKTELEKKEEVLNAYEAIGKEIFEKTPIVLPEEVSLPPANALYKLLEQKQEAGQLETYTQQKLAEIRQIRSNKSNGKDNNSKRERERERERAKMPDNGFSPIIGLVVLLVGLPLSFLFWWWVKKTRKRDT